MKYFRADHIENLLMMDISHNSLILLPSFTFLSLEITIPRYSTTVETM